MLEICKRCGGEFCPEDGHVCPKAPGTGGAPLVAAHPDEDPAGLDQYPGSVVPADIGDPDYLEDF